MIDTLSHLILESNNTNYTLALGFDALKSFDKWYKWHDFAELCDVKFYPRKGPLGELTPNEMHEILTNLLTPKPPLLPLNLSLVFASEKEKEPFNAVLSQFIPLGLKVYIEKVTTYAGSATDIRAFYKTHRHQRHPDVTQRVHDIILGDGCYQNTAIPKQAT